MGPISNYFFIVKANQQICLLIILNSMTEIPITGKAVSGIKPKIVKGQQNRFVSCNLDANSMAQLEANKLKQQQQQKRQKIQSFMNSTRMNASKLYKQQCEKNMQQLNTKKEQLQKQKQLKSKYTIIPKRPQTANPNLYNEKVQQLPKEPMQVNWKQAENTFKKVHIPSENCQILDSSAEESGYDSEIEPMKNQTPDQVVEVRALVRKQMLEKWKGKKM